MTTEVDADSQDFKLETKRITVNIDEVTDKIIENLIGVKGKSKSAVIYQLIQDWIRENSDKMSKDWNIDFSSIRRRVITKYQKVEAPTEEENEIIERLVQLFETIKSIRADELAEDLNIDIKTLKSIIYSYPTRFRKLGLRIVYEDEKYYKS